MKVETGLEKRKANIEYVLGFLCGMKEKNNRR